AAHEEGDPYHAFAPDHTYFTSQAIGECVDERHHGSGGEIQKCWGAIRVVEHIAERPGERFEVGQQARCVLLWERGKQAIVSRIEGLRHAPSLLPHWSVLCRAHARHTEEAPHSES